MPTYLHTNNNSFLLTFMATSLHPDPCTWHWPQMHSIDEANVSVGGGVSVSVLSSLSFLVCGQPLTQGTWGHCWLGAGKHTEAHRALHPHHHCGRHGSLCAAQQLTQALTLHCRGLQQRPFLSVANCATLFNCPTTLQVETLSTACQYARRIIKQSGGAGVRAG